MAEMVNVHTLEGLVLSLRDLLVQERPSMDTAMVAMGPDGHIYDLMGLGYHEKKGTFIVTIEFDKQIATNMNNISVVDLGVN